MGLEQMALQPLEGLESQEPQVSVVQAKAATPQGPAR